MATTAAPAAVSSADQNPKDAVDPAPPPSAKPDPPNSVTIPSAVAEAPQKDGEGLKRTVSTVGSVAENDSTLVSNIQKKVRRAERFGMPVQLSEEEKRNSRAERFGTGITSNGTEGLKKSEEQKRKARAERFGLSVPSTAADEEAKRKSRLARFAPYTKTDSQEEDKRKARAIRFSNPPANSLSQVNGKGNIELNAATIAGNAGGGS
ncbi:hypothetical protein SLEP1_g17696 [Rubroshorea leprosula]|uniref:THO1-MOS11 C-terminal domain-containing protein n=1 Tax=Rubroshorea leprosula TaxID=152421 RepID=A0AAV5IV37_9ROSI|nr:hypothetical protein SLEP1_g17696 [Rubroshorea leprosula]